MKWPKYGSTVFEIQQQYSTLFPKTLWLLVNEHGIDLLGRRTKQPLESHPYHHIASYSPTLKELTIVIETDDGKLLVYLPCLTLARYSPTRLHNASGDTFTRHSNVAGFCGA